MAIWSTWTQHFPPKPSFTEATVPSQKGRVFIVTGGNTGVGFELCKILYGKGGTVYMAARSRVSAGSTLNFAKEVVDRLFIIGTRNDRHSAYHFRNPTSNNEQQTRLPPP